MTTYSVTTSGQALTYTLSLDGNNYNAKIYWNIFGQRLYINIVDQYGNSILTLPLIASPPDTTTVNMLAGYFTSQMYYYEQNQVLVVV